MPRLIALEGIDGSGKGTQSQLLQGRLERAGQRARLISFPRYADTLFGKAVGDYLNGRFGRLDEVSPYLVSLLFAGDRFESRKLIVDAAADSDILLCDRYVASNIAHQAAKLDEGERREFVDWISRIEFDIFGIPRPDTVILLDVPVDVAQTLISQKSQRNYTDKAADLQEADGDYLRQVRDVYLSLAANDAGWHTVACCESGRLRTVEAISDEIWRLVAGG